MWTDEDFRSLGNREVFLQTVFRAIVENDMESLQDAIIGYLRYGPSKEDLAKRTSVAKRTLYNLLDKKRKFNPTVETLGAILKEIAA